MKMKVDLIKSKIIDVTMKNESKNVGNYLGFLRSFYLEQIKNSYASVKCSKTISGSIEKRKIPDDVTVGS